MDDFFSLDAADGASRGLLLWFRHDGFTRRLVSCPRPPGRFRKIFLHHQYFPRLRTSSAAMFLASPLPSTPPLVLHTRTSRTCARPSHHQLVVVTCFSPRRVANRRPPAPLNSFEVNLVVEDASQAHVRIHDDDDDAHVGTMHRAMHSCDAKVRKDVAAIRAGRASLLGKQEDGARGRS